jgi:hypothetical protein
MNGDNQRNDGDEDGRAGKDEVKPSDAGVMPVLMAFMFNHRVPSFKAA